MKQEFDVRPKYAIESCVAMGFQLCIQRILFYASTHLIGSYGSTVTLFSESLEQWENTDITLTCAYKGLYVGWFYWTLNNSLKYTSSYVETDCTVLAPWLAIPTEYDYRCINNTVHSLTLKNIKQNRHGETWRCGNDPGVFLTMSNAVQIFVQVPVKSTTITPNTNDVFTTEENTSFSWLCKTSECRPEPRFLWYRQANTQADGSETVISETSPRTGLADNIQSYNNTYRLTFNRTLNGWKLFCGAPNRNGSIAMSRKILINDTYPPLGPPRIGLYQNGSLINVIKNTFLDLVCSITGGNPLPRLQWNQSGTLSQTFSDSTVTNTITWWTSDNNRRDLICQSIQQHKNDTTHVTIDVLYPPEEIEATLIIDAEYEATIQHNFSVIENVSSTMILICSARSNPFPSSYAWTGPIQSTSAKLALHMTRYVRGIYICFANNTMIAHDGRTEHGYKSAPYSVEILQPPEIGTLADVKVVEGNDVSVACPIVSGNETWYSVKWLNKHSVPVGQNGRLLITNITRIVSGTYTCHLNFTLQPTYGLHKIDTIKKGFYLDVLYKAAIISFSINNVIEILTLNETARVHFVCNVDSNPSSMVVIEFNNKIVSSKSNTRTLDYLIPTVSCTDTGTYVCTGNNTYNIGQRARLEKRLFVTCSPRRSSFFEQKQNVTCGINDTATFQFTVMAYPPPSFQWYRVISGSKKSEAHGGVITNYNISTNEMQTNFYLEKVEETHYGEYLLKVENQYGAYSQTFYLVAEGKPNPPTMYGFYLHSISSDSVTIWWEPGYDGGLPQLFVLSYNLTTSKWHNETAISDNNERRMNKTITELASGSAYQIIIYAQNRKGAVRVSHAIIVNTKELQSTEALAKPKSVVNAVGGAVGGLFAVITVTVTLVVVRKRSIYKRTRAQNKACD